MSPSVQPTQNGHTSSHSPPQSMSCHTTSRIKQTKHEHRSLLSRCDDDELHDLICVGFGPASLAIAVALHDALECRDSGLGAKTPKIQFLERQQRFAWHAGMLLPGAKMQITFVKDLATLRNPRSKFTFLNYLHQKGRLVSFTNLGTFLPHRIEYEDYMRWCADHFNDVVEYSQNVETVDVGKADPRTGSVEYFKVTSRNEATGVATVRRAKHVVIAIGGKPNIPKCLRPDHPRVIHSSQYATHISNIFPPGTQPRSVAIIGAGQSAAEVFQNIPCRYPGAKSYLIIRSGALKPSDDSPFVNEIFDPERVDDIYSQAPNIRAASVALDKGTNYGVVRLELLEEIYSVLYTNRTIYQNEEQWPQRILNHREVTGMSSLSDENEPRVRLHLQDGSGSYYAHRRSREETLDVDLVVVASGYQRDGHREILKNLEHLIPDGEKSSKGFAVGRDYNVLFEPGSVASDAGVWLQGCNESTHGLSDTLLSILAVRGGEMVQNIFGSPGTPNVAEETNLTNGH